MTALPLWPGWLSSLSEVSTATQDVAEPQDTAANPPPSGSTGVGAVQVVPSKRRALPWASTARQKVGEVQMALLRPPPSRSMAVGAVQVVPSKQIGRASCRERV